MELWLAGAFLVLAIILLICLIVKRRKIRRKTAQTVAIVLTSVVIALLSIYILFAGIFIYSRDHEPPDDVETPVPTVSASPEPTFTPAPTDTPEPAETETPEPTFTPVPDEWDLPVSALPEFLPDVLGIREIKYEEMPVVKSVDEATCYILHEFLNNRMHLKFYFDRGIPGIADYANVWLNDACDNAFSYYLFSAYNIFTMMAEDRGDEKGIYAEIELRYTNPEYDKEACAEAMEFVIRNPVPEGGFKTREEEMEYAREIHDFIICRISYDPIGYDPDNLISSDKYKIKQEAYNALASEDTSAVCAGYARGFALIAHYAGIDCAWVNGNRPEEENLGGHAWNILYPCDGSEPVIVDVTWDDRDSFNEDGSEYIDYSFFYLPLSDDTLHHAEEDMGAFLDFIHNKMK